MGGVLRTALCRLPREPGPEGPGHGLTGKGRGLAVAVRNQGACLGDVTWVVGHLWSDGPLAYLWAEGDGGTEGA